MKEMNREDSVILSKKSLKGISIGDAFGESFFGERSEIIKHIEQKKIPVTSWEFTDDTIMALAVFEQLEKHGDIRQNDLAEAFSKNHQLDLNRGYGATARRILREIEEGGNWKEISTGVFDGMGSMGNGASMRVGPIGAYYFNDLEKVKNLAIKSAVITHANIEGITGAIAVALGTAVATRVNVKGQSIRPDEFIREILSYLPECDTKSKINKSLSVPYNYRIATVESILGNGVKIIAQDTVPFALWCASHNLDNFEASIWKAVSILGDRDTICAIVGGITMMSTSPDKIPTNWIESVEDFETSVFRHGNI